MFSFACLICLLLLLLCFGRRFRLRVDSYEAKIPKINKIVIRMQSALRIEVWLCSKCNSGKGRKERIALSAGACQFQCRRSALQSGDSRQLGMRKLAQILGVQTKRNTSRRRILVRSTFGRRSATDDLEPDNGPRELGRKMKRTRGYQKP